MTCFYVVQMDIDADREAEFNRLYDEEHIPNLLAVPGVIGCRRFRLIHGNPPTAARYLAIYTLTSPEVRQSDAWTEASDTGLWKARIRPFTFNKSHLFFEAIDLP